MVHLRQALPAINRLINIINGHSLRSVKTIAEVTYNGFVLRNKGLCSQAHRSFEDFYGRLKVLGTFAPTSFNLGSGFWILYLIKDMDRVSQMDQIL